MRRVDDAMLNIRAGEEDMMRAAVTFITRDIITLQKSEDIAARAFAWRDYATMRAPRYASSYLTLRQYASAFTPVANDVALCADMLTLCRCHALVYNIDAAIDEHSHAINRLYFDDYVYHYAAERYE